MLRRRARWLWPLALLVSWRGSGAAQGNAEALAVTRRDSSEKPTPNLDRVARLQVVSASLASAVQSLALSSGVPIAYKSKLLADKPWGTCDCRDLTVRQ